MCHVYLSVLGMDWLLLEKGIWFGFAALGFAILFNVPGRTLVIIWLLAAMGGLTKIIFLNYGVNVILSSFAGASLIGFASIPMAHYKHTPPLIFSIPALIPMVPGAFAYRTMLGLMNLTVIPTNESYSQILNETVSNGFKTLFIVMTLAVGASIPMLVTRKSSAKQLRIKVKKP